MFRITKGQIVRERTATCPSGNTPPAINSGCAGVVDIIQTVLRHRIDLHNVAENHKRWESVCKFCRKKASAQFRHCKENRTEDADGGNNRSEIAELGDGGPDDEGESPVNDRQCSEDVLSGLDRQRRSTE